MPTRWLRFLGCAVGLTMLGAACNGPLVIHDTIVVTATTSSDQPTVDVPTLVPTDTQIPPTVAPPPPPTKVPPPQPTLPQLVIEAIPGQLKAQVLHPDYFNGAHTSLNFQVEAYDPEVGNKDGAGIKSVEFHIFDENGNEVWKQIEQNVPYCSFGGDSPCPVYVFAQHGNKWPNGQPIQNGSYSLQVNVHAQNSDKDENNETDFNIQIGQ